MMHCNVYDALQCVQDVCAVLQMICVYNTTDTIQLEHITYLHQTWAEMQKATSMASVLVLFFPPAVLIFGRSTHKTC